MNVNWKLVNWERVAKTLRTFAPKKFYHADDRRDFDLAIELCEQHATQKQDVTAVVPSYPRPPDPTPEMLESPEFEAVWQIIKNWDVDHGGGMRSGATGNDVRAILDALSAVREKR